MNFKDHFSGHAAVYREARPHYDPALFAWLAAQVPRHELAWDAGCGNGQATVALAAHFARVVGSDPSEAQIAHAAPAANVEYRVEPAEHSSLADASADLVCVAQALHWFEQERFHAEVRRVLHPGGVIAALAYASCRVTPAVDRVTAHLYVDLTGPYWPPERAHIEAGYATLPFPYTPIPAPAFDMVAQWNLGQFLAYLRSWSATQRYAQARGEDPVARVAADMAAAWGDAAQVRAVRWQLTLRVGRG